MWQGGGFTTALLSKLYVNKGRAVLLSQEEKCQSMCICMCHFAHLVLNTHYFTACFFWVFFFNDIQGCLLQSVDM